MTIYIIMFISCFCCCLLSSRVKSKFFSLLFGSLSIIIPSVIAGNRSLSIGTDISVYGEYMHYVASHSTAANFFSTFGYQDVFFSLITLITGSLSKDIHFYLFVLQLLNCTLIYKACKNYEDKVPVCISYLLFLLILYFRQLNLLRQGLSLSFSILAISYLLKDNKKKFFVFWVFAIFSHISAIVLILAYFLYRFENRKSGKKYVLSTTYIVLLVILILFLPFLRLVTSIGILPSKYTYEYFTHYLNINHEIDSLGTFFKLFWCIVTFVIGSKKNIKSKISNFNFLFHLVFIDFILWNFNIYIHYADRLSFYFGFAYVLFLLPQFLVLFKKEYSSKVFYYVILILLFSSYWYIRFVIQNAGSVYPYIHY